MDAAQRELSDQIDLATQRLLDDAGMDLAEPMRSQRRDRLSYP
jgi:hypothetical protein